MTIKGRVLFQDETKFNFGDTGLTVVHGLNTNGGHRNTNAAGKSFLMSTLQDLVYRDVLVGSRRDRVTEGYVSLEFGKSREDVHNLTLTKKKLSVSKDGAPLKIREQAEVYNLVKGILPATIEAYSTLVHLDNRVPHPLIRGETDARKKFFTKFFELDTTDPLRKLASLDLADIKSSGKLLTDKKTRHAHLVENKQNTTELGKRLKALQIKRDAMQSTIDTYQDNAALRQFVTEHKDDLGSVPDTRAITRRIAELEAALENAAIHEEYSADVRAWRKSLNLQKQYLEANDIPEVVPSAELAVCRKTLDKIEAYNDAKQELDSEIRQIKERLRDLVEPEAHGSTAGVCEACGSVLTGKLAAKHKATAQALMDKYLAAKSALKAKGREARSKLTELVAPEGDDVSAIEQRIKILQGVPKVADKPAKPNATGQHD